MKKLKNFFKNILTWITTHKIISILLGASIICIVTLGVVFATSSLTDTVATSDETTEEETTTSEEEATTEDTDTDSEEDDDDINYDCDYLIKVNRAMNCITIYTEDDDGEFTVPYKAMVCSTGTEGGNETPTGTFSITDKYTWRLMVDGSYGQYACRISGSIMFHSVTYYGTTAKNNTDLEYTEYNKLGSFASLGCVRLCCADALWIYTNCESGTTVIIYDDETSPGPLGKPTAYTLPYDDETLIDAIGKKKLLSYCGWDPTDPDEDNPWTQFTIEGDDTIEVTVGSDISDVLDQISAEAPNGADIPSSYLEVDGTYDLNTIGTYTITVNYDTTQIPALIDSVTFTINVVEEGTDTEEKTTIEDTDNSTDSTTDYISSDYENSTLTLTSPGSTSEVLDNITIIDPTTGEELTSDEKSDYYSEGYINIDGHSWNLTTAGTYELTISFDSSYCTCDDSVTLTVEIVSSTTEDTSSETATTTE